MNKQALLLKTMLTSTGSINIIKYSDDKKKRGLAIGNIIGMSFLYIILAGMMAVMSYGMAFFGFGEMIP